MLKLHITLLLLVSLNFSYGQSAQKDINASNYLDYYKAINHAETLFFMKGKADKALALYDTVFKNYDFIFLTNLMEAAQIAKFTHQPYKKYLKRGFNFGLKLSHLKNYPLFKDDLVKLQQDNLLSKAYQKGRKHYLNRIDFNYLNWVYKLYIKDQLDKNKPHYKDVINRSLTIFRHQIKKKGFPGEWIVGIPDSAIFSAHGIPQLDLKEQVKKYGEKLSYAQIENDNLSPTKIFSLLVHHPCSFQKLERLLLEEMSKGHIYPRSLGMLHDNIYRFSNNPAIGLPSYCNLPQQHYFRLNLFCHPPKLTKENLRKTDSLRAAFYIVSYEVDKRKKEFQEKYGFRLFPRYWEPFQKLESAKDIIIITNPTDGHSK